MGTGKSSEGSVNTPSATGHRKQVVYLAGPMRGYVEYNFPAFHAAAAKLRAHGLEVWSPAENDVNQDGFDPAKDTAQPMRHYMRRDLPAVLEADFVCVLPGWEKSQGAQLEVHVARTCGIPVYNALDMTHVSAASEKKEQAFPRLESDTDMQTVYVAFREERDGDIAKNIRRRVDACIDVDGDGNVIGVELFDMPMPGEKYERLPEDR